MQKNVRIDMHIVSQEGKLPFEDTGIQFLSAFTIIKPKIDKIPKRKLPGYMNNGLNKTALPGTVKLCFSPKNVRANNLTGLGFNMLIFEVNCKPYTSYMTQ